MKFFWKDWRVVRWEREREEKKRLLFTTCKSCSVSSLLSRLLLRLSTRFFPSTSHALHRLAGSGRLAGFVRSCRQVLFFLRERE